MRNKKLFGLFNLFDILFMGLFLLLLVFSYYRYNLSSKKELFGSDVDIWYTGYVNKVNSSLIDNIRIDEKIYMVTVRENTYLEMGKIMNVELIPYKDVFSGEVEFYDVILTINVKGSVINNTYLSYTNVRLYEGTMMNVTTHDVIFNMEIEDVREEF